MGQGFEKLKVKSYPDRKQRDHIERLKILVIFDAQMDHDLEQLG